jgi:hypothetical protein
VPPDQRTQQTLTPPTAAPQVPDRRDSFVTLWDFADGQGRRFALRVVNDRARRERAYRLVGRAYSRCGYTDPERPWASPFDADPASFAALIETGYGTDAGTISVHVDGRAGLACDATSRDGLAPLRAQKRRLAEVGHLALDERYIRSRQVLIALFDCISIYLRHVTRSDDLLIEAHPRHVPFYRQALAFEAIGAPRTCPRARGVPVVPMRLDLRQAAELIREHGGRGRRAGSRLLYPFFLPLEFEPPIASDLARAHRPMTPEDIFHFRLDAPRAQLPWRGGP